MKSRKYRRIFATMLQKLKNSIPLLILLIFLYPTFYQLDHILHLPGWHHQHPDEGAHSHAHSCCGHHHCNDESDESEADDHDSGQQQLNNHQEDCLVCEFHFTFLHKADSFYWTAKSQFEKCFSQKYIKHPYVSFKGHIRQFRAPPSIS